MNFEVTAWEAVGADLLFDVLVKLSINQLETCPKIRDDDSKEAKS